MALIYGIDSRKEQALPFTSVNRTQFSMTGQDRPLPAPLRNRIRPSAVYMTFLHVRFYCHSKTLRGGALVGLML